MNAANAVQLFILVWTFTAVCQADKNISCDDVTGTVGKEVNFTCSVSWNCAECSITMYKFQYPESFNDSAICAQELPKVSCEQSSFTCRYTPTTAMTEQFRFFVQTKYGMGKAKFTVDTKVYLKHMDPEIPSRTSPPDTAAGLGSNAIVIAAVVSGFIIIMMIIIYKTKPNFTKLCRFQNKMFLGVRHDDDNNRPENESSFV